VYILRAFLLKNLADDVTADMRFLNQRADAGQFGMIHWDPEDENENLDRQNGENVATDARIVDHVTLENNVNQWEGGSWKEVDNNY